MTPTSFTYEFDEWDARALKKKLPDGWNNSLEWLANQRAEQAYADKHGRRNWLDWYMPSPLEQLARAKDEVRGQVWDAAVSNWIDVGKLARLAKDAARREEADAEREASYTEGEAVYAAAARQARHWSRHWREAGARLAREAAGLRAERLLLRYLEPAQRSDYLALGTVMVRAPSGARYRLRKGRLANIDVLDARGGVRHRLCVHPAADVPDADTLLAQVLALRHDEAALLAAARIHPAAEPRPPMPLAPVAREVDPREVEGLAALHGATTAGGVPAADDRPEEPYPLAV